MSLAAHVVVRRGTLALDVELAVADGEVLAVLGPNGAGKSTVLRVLAGLLRPDAGRVEVDAEVWNSPDVHLPAHARSLGMVFQDHLLFPHLSVTENVAFGPRTRGTPRPAARAAAEDWLARVGLAGLGDRRPGQLSGGQAQRAALARALVGRPQLLLLDEPLSALDARTRLTVRAELHRHLGDYPGSAVLVTHDPVDAMALADRVVVIEEGRVVQAGTPAEVARRPRTDYVARLVGLVLLAGQGAGTQVALDGGGVVAVAEDVAGPVFVAVRPESVALYLQRPVGSPRNVWPLRLAAATPHGSVVRCDLAGEVPLTADVTATSFAELGLAPGAEVWASVKASELTVYPR
ncbi:ABC transporter ATP-binding protein [Modestobacter sp. VKM Ac-2979]|uniref:ABC transporter ATP-binding protein n=1 Tax=unclassified Modestobacter TaxID=2643866 RepID=UPI0022ABC050|nr:MULTISPECIES: ABC transporter ATP-binding protein [unclassified Modestobacter]MCZ2811065.1 ABC transporter ATP-binding protein [Modestobacter sp. VKM Ac-2979]MCZ2840578.1 ABC transporter ATP-binding protein [Modestobacter sp. VKM Ac-2980]